MHAKRIMLILQHHQKIVVNWGFWEESWEIGYQILRVSILSGFRDVPETQTPFQQAGL